MPGAVQDEDGAALFKRVGGGSGSGSGDGDAAAADAVDRAQGDKAASELGSESQATTNTAADGGMVSDYGRGKRLRKLVRLLSSKAASQVVLGFRFKVIVLIAAICIIHMGAFGAFLGFIGKQDAYVDEVAAAGEVLDTVHRIASLSLVLEAAQRGYGFTSSDTPTYAAELEISYNRYAPPASKSETTVQQLQSCQQTLAVQAKFPWTHKQCASLIAG